MSRPALLPPDDPRLISSHDLGLTRELLRSMRGLGPDGERVRAELAEVAATRPDALDRTCRPGHFTGSAFVVDATGTRCLVLFHTKLRKWLQPGGHADGDANLAAVARREATEETGIDGLSVALPPIDVDVHEVRPPAEDAHLHLDVRFLVVAPPGAVEVGNHESEELRWVTADELASLSDEPGLHRLAAAGFALAARLLA